MSTTYVKQTWTYIYLMPSYIYPPKFCEELFALFHIIHTHNIEGLERNFNALFIVMKLAHKKIEKKDQRLRNQPLRGGNLLYITQMNNSSMIQMKRPPLYI